ncbi:glycosyltransferase family 2 protein [Tardiphaga sp. vice154]|uniref:glycosyltransferase family 2 protein n=1 Tax=Tardiphaga sp. vice154 TaxID=2592814 RepID=UPI0011622A72|nr:glycosyltransferase family 2 protein [Tardiphaga sp. vice154]QDM23028.1 glycosyltransferase family 2 protein [Tardiphaga sp. vice154]
MVDSVRQEARELMKDIGGETRTMAYSHDHDRKRIENLKRDLAQAEVQIVRLQDEIDSITRSPAWLMGMRLQNIAGKFPPGVRRKTFHILRSGYRVLRYKAPILFRMMAGPRLVAMLRRTTPGMNRSIAQQYTKWIGEFDTISAADRSEIAAHIAKFQTLPLISVIMPVYNTPERILRDAVASVLNQIYPHWELCIADDGSTAPHIRTILEEYREQDSRIRPIYRETNGHISAASNSALALATGDYVALLDHDDVLSEHALYMIAEAIQRHPDADVFYSDEDKLDSSGQRCDPHFKPEWSPELFYGQNYLNHLSAYKRSAVDQAGGFRIGYEGSQDYDLALRVIAKTRAPIVHIPYVLYHWRIFDGASTMSSNNLRKATEAARRALIDYFSGHGETVAVEDVLGSFHRILRPDPADWPKVSVIVPTRDYLDVLRVAIDGLEHTTDYPDLEIIIADNESTKPETLKFFSEVQTRGVRIVECKGAFNYSAINNKAIAVSTGEYVLLLNNDISMINSDWLKEMVRYLSNPEVGIVGPKLLYPDGTLQHAGVVLGIGGVAGHRYAREAGDEPGAFGRLALAQDVSAVTGACLLIRRALFQKLGGLDAANLAVAFNDIDLCMQVRAAGYRIIWTPYSVLAHHESKSRGLDTSGEKQERFLRESRFMRRKWGNRLMSDPFYNPNLSLNAITPELARPPRLRKPWKV